MDQEMSGIRREDHVCAKEECSIVLACEAEGPSIALPLDTVEKTHSQQHIRQLGVQHQGFDILQAQSRHLDAFQPNHPASDRTACTGSSDPARR